MDEADENVALAVAVNIVEGDGVESLLRVGTYIGNSTLSNSTCSGRSR